MVAKGVHSSTFYSPSGLAILPPVMTIFNQEGQSMVRPVSHSASLIERGLGWLHTYATYRNRFDGLLRSADVALGDLLYAMTSVEEKDAIIRACYTSTHHVRGGGRTTLFDWEETWFAQDLPPAPARILVGGCGWGREVRALKDRGYSVVGFDPLAGPAGSGSDVARIVAAGT